MLKGGSIISVEGVPGTQAEGMAVFLCAQNLYLITSQQYQGATITDEDRCKTSEKTSIDHTTLKDISFVAMRNAGGVEI